MENKDLQNEIVEAAATKAADLTNNAVETKAAEINEKLETKADSAAVEKLAMSVDKLVENQKSFNIGSAKRSSKEEMAAAVKSGIAGLTKRGDTFTVKSEDFGLDFFKKDLDIAAGSDDYQAYREGMISDIKYDPNHQTRLMNHLPTYNLPGSGAIRYNQESSLTDNTSVKNEGAAATSNVQNIQPVTEPANTIVSALTVPNEWMDEITGIDGYVSQRLLGLLQDELDTQILTGNGSNNQWTGLNQHAPAANRLTTKTLAATFFGDAFDLAVETPNNYDLFVATAGQLESDNFRPGLVIINPADYRALALIKDADAQYVSLQAMANDRAWTYFNGLRIVPNSAQAQGTYTLVDTSAVGVFASKGVTLEFGLNDDDFISNNITARAMVRGGVAGFRPDAFVTGTMAEAIKAIDVSDPS